MCGSFEVVYRNHKGLEGCKDLHVWLTRVFGTNCDTFIHRRVFSEPHSPRNELVVPEPGIRQVNIEVDIERRLVHCYAIAPGGSLLVCVSNDGTVIFGKLFLSSEVRQFEDVDDA
jgi:hypothetical protein